MLYSFESADIVDLKSGSWIQSGVWSGVAFVQMSGYFRVISSPPLWLLPLNTVPERSVLKDGRGLGASSLELIPTFHRFDKIERSDQLDAILVAVFGERSLDAPKGG